MNPEKFPLCYFQGFDAVILALDNEPARSYLNRICGPLGIPLFEAGTSGFAGQTYPIIWGKTRCYDCLPKPTAKTFPVCTIRTVPTKPIHCMVWAKQVFNELFDIGTDGLQVFDQLDLAKSIETLFAFDFDNMDHVTTESSKPSLDINPKRKDIEQNPEPSMVKSTSSKLTHNTSDEPDQTSQKTPSSKLLDSLKAVIHKHGPSKCFFVVLRKLFYTDVTRLKENSQGRLRFIRPVDFKDLVDKLRKKKETCKSNLLSEEKNASKQKEDSAILKNEAKNSESKGFNPKIEDLNETPVRVIKEDTLKLERDTSIINVNQDAEPESSQKAQISKSKDEDLKQETKNSNEISKQTDQNSAKDLLVFELEMFIKSVLGVLSHTKDNQHRVKNISFDKDVKSHVDLVKSLTNFRCFVYNIPHVTEEDLRKTIGNIVPAISHTNSIIAGLLFQNIQKVFVRQFLRNKRLNRSNHNDKVLKKMSRNQVLFYQVLRTREYALINGKMQKLLNLTNLGPSSKCSACSIPRSILTLPRDACKQFLTASISRSLDLQEFSVFYKGELVLERFEGDSESESEYESLESDPDYGKTPIKHFERERLLKIKHDVIQKKPRRTFQMILGHLDAAKRRKPADTKDAKSAKTNPESIAQDVSTNKIQELLVLNEDSKPVKVFFVTFDSNRVEISFEPAGSHHESFNFILIEMALPHLNNYVLAIDKINLNIGKVCSLDSDSKSSRKTQHLGKRDHFNQGTNGEKVLSILKDPSQEVLHQKRIKES